MSLTPVTDAIQGMTPQEAANYKGQQIAALGSLPRQTVVNFDIEVVSLEAMEGGVIAFIRAWQADQQIGFGEGGIVDIERVKIFNPSIHANDGRWTTVEGMIGGELKSWQEQTFVEDLSSALLNEIEHVVSVIPKTLASQAIIPGRIGNTVATFNSVAGANSPVDGEAWVSALDVTFANLRSHAGTSASASQTFLATGHIEASTTSNQFKELHRCFLCFDTSSLGSSAVISSAVLSLYGNGNQTSQLGGTPSLQVAGSTLDSTADTTTADYQHCSTATSYGSFNYPLTVGAYNDITLNASGIAAISLTGITQFSVQNNWDFAASFTGTWGSSKAAYAYCESRDNASSSKWPKLVVTYTAPTTLNLSENLSTSIIERFSRLWTAPRNRSEVVALQGESISRTWNAPRSPSDVVTITETLTGIKGRIIEILESLGITETFERVVTYSRDLSESFTISEIFSKMRTAVIDVLETLVIVESVVISKVLSILLTDVSVIIEYVRTPLNWLKRTKPTTNWSARTPPSPTSPWTKRTPPATTYVTRNKP